MAIYTLQMFYELRKTVAVTPRRVTARAFVARGKYGFSDASGVLWPVYFRPQQTPPAHGDVVTFVCTSFRPDGARASKFEDSGYMLVIDEVIERVPSAEGFPISGDANPIPDSDFFSGDLPSSSTYFFETKLVRRTRLLRKRAKAIQCARDFFVERNFLDCDTPTLVPCGGVENYLTSFRTSYKDYRNKTHALELPTSPEFALKKLLTEGHGKIFQLAKSYRNEGQLTPWHEPEFFMLEWYRKGAALVDVMHDTQRLVEILHMQLGSNYELPSEWKTHKVADLLRDHAGIALEKVQDVAVFRKAAEKSSPSIVETDDWDSVFCKVFMEKIEPFLKTQRACFVTEYPIQMAALAKATSSKITAHRFEAYLDGVEICNGYDELTDAEELRARFDKTTSTRSDLTQDSLFNRFMKFGLPPCSGNALGLDRVIAVLLKLQSIRDLYPISFLNQFEKNSVAAE